MQYSNQRIMIDDSEKILDPHDRQGLSFSPVENSGFSHKQTHSIQQQSPPQILHVLQSQHLQVPPPISLGGGIQGGLVPGMMPLINTGNSGMQPQMNQSMNQQQQRFPMRGGYLNFITVLSYQEAY